MKSLNSSLIIHHSSILTICRLSVHGYGNKLQVIDIYLGCIDFDPDSDTDFDFLVSSILLHDSRITNYDSKIILFKLSIFNRGIPPPIHHSSFIIHQFLLVVRSRFIVPESVIGLGTRIEYPRYVRYRGFR